MHTRAHHACMLRVRWWRGRRKHVSPHTRWHAWDNASVDERSTQMEGTHAAVVRCGVNPSLPPHPHTSTSTRHTTGGTATARGESRATSKHQDTYTFALASCCHPPSTGTIRKTNLPREAPLQSDRSTTHALPLRSLRVRACNRCVQHASMHATVEWSGVREGGREGRGGKSVGETGRRKIEGRGGADTRQTLPQPTTHRPNTR
jgi:hypothetical protein